MGLMPWQHKYTLSILTWAGMITCKLVDTLMSTSKAIILPYSLFFLIILNYVPSFSKNLVLVSRFYNVGYRFLFVRNIFSILKNKVFIGGGTLIDGLYIIDLNLIFNPNYLSIHVDFSINWSKIEENSSMLWHKRLDHISIKRIKRLVNDKVLSTLDFIDLVLV